MSRPRYAMTVDTKRCVGCHACVYACKAENDVPEGGYRDWIEVETRGRFPHLTQQIRSERCKHCEHPPCVSACPTGASHVNEGGTVLVTKHKCTGCKACIASCPYDARYVHEDGYVDKCTFCLHRVKKGKQPACVTVCPTKALVFGDLSDPKSDISQLLASRKHEVKEPERGLEPQLFYLT
ncbi:MAG: 4Fe-4S dicluster domain-containing protein [Deltaproteobacteria bacterium]|jgi:Fe-S-cluster-containing dehydrogenase component|nr:4Fe-4S dicluster domain-containing protein [Deltaproteobacteria bacterium]MBW2534556.1 4Fe-4S dicluster domain-containing protein [Deltaproteobacteria bacterium]